MKKPLFAIISVFVLLVACKKQEGCTYTTATNYDSLAEYDDGSCVFVIDDSCSYSTAYIEGTAVSSFTAPDNSVITESGIHQIVIPNAEGCDSIITIDLTITPPAAIGDFRDGGIVFWLDGNDGGLLCAIEDQSSGIQWFNGSQKWTGAGGAAIGKGEKNTDEIIKDLGDIETDYAAGLARAYNGGGYADWFLPSKSELAEMNKYETLINEISVANDGSALVNVYWSSTEYNTDYSYQYVFPADAASNAFPNNKSKSCAVRAVRAF